MEAWVVAGSGLTMGRKRLVEAQDEVGEWAWDRALATAMECP